MLVGDFNAICTASECSRRGGSISKRSQFFDWINSLGLIDMGFSGSPFTWAHGRHHGTHIIRRLDRVMCNVEGRLLWQDASVQHLSRDFSDHSQILITLQRHTNSPSPKRTFHFLVACRF